MIPHATRAHYCLTKSGQEPIERHVSLKSTYTRHEGVYSVEPLRKVNGSTSDGKIASLPLMTRSLILGRQGRRQTLPVVAEPASPPLTPRRATWLVLGREATRTEVEAQQLTQLHAQSAEVAEAIDLAQDFAQLVRQRQPASLDPWLQRAASSPLEALRRFAQGLSEDYDAVKAGVTVPWSNGPVEGHINRLKMLKRQMFGRAHLDLLNRRFLLAPRHERTRVSHAEAAAAARAPPAALHPLHQKWVRTEVMRQSCAWSPRRRFSARPGERRRASLETSAPRGGDFLSSLYCIFNENLTHKFAILLL